MIRIVSIAAVLVLVAISTVNAIAGSQSHLTSNGRQQPHVNGGAR
jgi:hypothetical protein